MKLRRWLPNIVTLVLAAVLVLAQQVWASPLAARLASPTVTSKASMAYQGYLIDSAGAPVTDTLEMVFNIYSVESGGTPLWAETQASVAVTDGVFSVLLGSVTAIPAEIIASNDDLWLGVTIGSDEEMTPRDKIASAPYAMMADVPDGSITAAKLAPDAVAIEVPVGAVISWWRPTSNTPVPSEQYAIADGSVVNDPESPFNGQTLPNLTDRFVMGVGPASIGVTGGQNVLNLAHSHTVDAHSHTVNAHSHTVNAHTHTIAAHSHTVSSHTHSLPAHNHSVSGTTGEVLNFWDGGYYNSSGDGKRFADNTYGTTWYYRHDHSVSLNTNNWSGTSGAAAPGTSSVALTTASAAPGTSNASPGTSSASPGTNSKLSSTTENRPAYVGLVYLVRIK